MIDLAITIPPYSRVGRYKVTRTGKEGLKTNLSKEAVDLLDIDVGEQLEHYLMEMDGELVIVISKEPLPGDLLGKARIKKSKK